MQHSILKMGRSTRLSSFRIRRAFSSILEYRSRLWPEAKSIADVDNLRVVAILAFTSPESEVNPITLSKVCNKRVKF